MRGKGHPRQGSSLEFACPPPDAAPQKCAQPALAVPRGWVSASPEPRGAERQASQRGVVPRIAAQGAQGDGGEPSVPQAGGSPGRWVPPSGHSPAEPVLSPGRCPRGVPMCRCADPPHRPAAGTAEGAGGFSPRLPKRLLQQGKGRMRGSREVTETCSRSSSLSPGEQWGGCKVPGAGPQREFGGSLLNCSTRLNSSE